MDMVKPMPATMPTTATCLQVIPRGQGGHAQLGRQPAGPQDPDRLAEHQAQGDAQEHPQGLATEGGLPQRHPGIGQGEEGHDRVGHPAVEGVLQSLSGRDRLLAGHVEGRELGHELMPAPGVLLAHGGHAGLRTHEEPLGAEPGADGRHQAHHHAGERRVDAGGVGARPDHHPGRHVEPRTADAEALEGEDEQESQRP